MFFLFIIFYSNQSFSQTNSVDKYFDDGGISEARNTVKFNFASLIVGDLSLSYEREIVPAFHIEAGFGLLLNYYTVELPYRFSEGGVNSDIVNPMSGYSFFVFPKMHFNLISSYARSTHLLYSIGVDTYYIGLMYRARNYNLENNHHTEFNDYIFVFGLQNELWGHFVIDISYGLGVRKSISTLEPLSRPDEISVVFPIHLKLGYLF